MAKITLRQGNVPATLSDVYYRPDEGFLADNTWCVSEAAIEAGADAQLFTGPATIRRGQMQFEVTIVVCEFQGAEEEEDIVDGEPVCSIEIEYKGKLRKLALELGLLEHLSPKQRREIAGGGNSVNHHERS